MATIADAFTPPDARDRGFALVGRFLHSWAIMESEIRRAIGKALDLNDMQSVFVCANISLRDKINILKTAIDVSAITRADADAYKKILDAIATHAAVRNMIAHDFFYPSDDGQTVSFFVVKAKGKFSLPDEVWNVDRFLAEFSGLNQWTEALKEITGKLGQAKLVEALARLNVGPTGTPPKPTSLPFGLGLQGLLNLPPLGPPNSTPPPSTEETSPQTPKEPED